MEPGTNKRAARKATFPQALDSRPPLFPFTTFFTYKTKHFPPCLQLPPFYPIAGKQMSSIRRILANQANGRRSSGPITLDGKARSAMSALSHGLLARIVLMQDESP